MNSHTTEQRIPGSRSLDVLRKQYVGSPAGAPGVGGPRGPMGGPRRGGGPGVHAKGKPKNMRATVRRLLSYVTSYRWQLLLVFCFMIVNTAASLYGSFQIK
ncbi:MAG: hypothetical protein J6S41_01595, partial [Clostridia bacterium]|nr:hypothetical protein [Clostridia bacterium]